jgi:hypothetical protein
MLGKFNAAFSQKILRKKKKFRAWKVPVRDALETVDVSKD